MTRLLRGAPGSGKTAFVFEEFKQTLCDGRRDMRIVVPTATLVRHFRHELARDGVVFPPGCVVTLSRFARDCAPPVPLVPQGLLRAFVRDALRRLRPAEFSEVATTEGMAATLLETIALFENAAWTPAHFAAVRKLPASARAFRAIWQDVDAAITAAGFQTRGAIFRAAVPPAGHPRVWLDGFLTFSPVERLFVKALAETCDLALTLPDSPAADETHRFALQLNPRDRLLSGAARAPETLAVPAATPEREADEIARRILELRDAGTPFREIGIALRDTALYHPLLRATFHRFGIPARFYFATPLRQHPAATFLSGLIDCVRNGWDFATALDALRAHPAWGVSAAFDRFDFDVREVLPRKGAADLLGLSEEGFHGRLEPCLRLASWAGETATPPDWAARLEDMARRLYRPGLIEPAADPLAVETARSHTAALSAWVEAVRSAAGFWADAKTPLALADFWVVAQEVIDGASVQVADDRRDVVHVMNAYEARQWDVAALFVCGATDRDFPRRNPQNLLFPDADIAALRLPLRTAAERDNEEPALWEALRSRARHTLVMTWPRHNEGGGSVQSSRYLCDLGLPAASARPCRPTPPAAAEETGLAGRIVSPELLPALAERHLSISLTKLEDMLQCRFKFFADRTLSLRPRPERPDERLRKNVQGLVLHKALEDWLRNNRRDDFVELFEAAFDRAVEEHRVPPGFRLEVERATLREVARKVNATEPWHPLSSEPEVEVSLGFPGGVTIKGRVDRIDRMSDTECVIVDYKSGRVQNVEKLVESDAKLQGPLYALAVHEHFGLRTLAMMYIAVREDKRFGWGAVPGADLDLKAIPPDWMQEARRRAVERLSDFLSGAVYAEPADSEGCRWCDYRNACRVQEPREQPLVMIQGAQNV